MFWFCDSVSTNLAMLDNRHVFLSHSSVDAALARRLAVDLIDLGADIWLDQLSLGVGERILESIETAVDQTALMLVLVSEESLASGWVQLEWRRLGVAGGHVVPVRLAQCRMPDELASQTFIDLAGGAYWRGVAQIAQRIGVADIRPPAIMVPDFLALANPIQIELGSAIAPVFRTLSQENDPAEVAISEMRARIRDSVGVMPPGIRFVSDIGDMPPMSCQILINDIPRTFVEIGGVSDAMSAVMGLVEDAIISHFDQFIDPDSCSALYEVPYLTSGQKSRATTGELTAIFRESTRLGLSLVDMSALDALLPAERTGPLDVVGIAEGLRPYQAERLSKAATVAGEIRALTLDPALEEHAEGCLIHLSMGTQINLAPEWTDVVLSAIRLLAQESGANALIVETPVLRGYFERLQYGELTTLARRDLHTDAPLRILGTVSLEGHTR